ncbi:hypothetical protein BGZ73_008652 [Actinomortierella ambigua]|nr:hypothetical protein BGZ73_008652 [Actinomortierella ambigua]
MSSSSSSASNAPGETQELHSSTLLDCDSVIALLRRLLPSPDQSASPAAAAESTQAPAVLLSSPYAALAALVHAMMTAVGFRLVGLSEEDKLEGDRQSTDPTVSNLLPQRWGASNESYSFRYTHGHSQLTYLIKCVRIANKFVIHGTTLETNKICSLELDVQGYTSASYFPFTAATDLSRDPLWNGFISRSRINDLIREFKLQIVQQLIPGLSKPGYEEERSSTSTSAFTGSSSATANQQRQDRDRQRIYDEDDDPLRIPGRSGGGRFIPRPPLFGEPFSPEDVGPHHNPFSIGRQDLDPFGGSFGPGGLGGLGGPGGIGGSSGGGMIVGPDHPMFRRPPGSHGGGGGLYGGPQPLPRGSVPPGARFDPIGPFNPVGGNAPGAGTAHGPPPPGAGRGRGTQFPGEPDNDELPPPGYMDMFM